MLAEDPGAAGSVTGDRFGFGGRSRELGRLSDILERDAGAVALPADMIADHVAPAGPMHRGAAVVITPADLVGVLGPMDRHAQECRDRLVPQILDADAVARRHARHVLACPAERRPY